jgi:hypothetical protein
MWPDTMKAIPPNMSRSSSSGASASALRTRSARISSNATVCSACSPVRSVSAARRFALEPAARVPVAGA